MKFLPEYELTVNKPVDYPPLNRGELRDMVYAFESGERISPDDTRRLVHTDIDGRSRRVNAVATGVGAGLFATHVVAKTAVKTHGDSMPTFGIIPKAAREILQTVYDLYPIGAEKVGPTAQEHVPMLVLGAALGYTTLELGRRLADGKFNRQARATKASIEAACSDGTMNWKITEGSTVAFVGDGDPLATELANRRPVDMLQIAYSPVDAPWTYLPRDSDRSATVEALKRANIENAGELVFFPIERRNEFLPGPGDHDISLDRMVSYITTADEYCDEKGVGRLPISVIGSKQQSESYIEAAHSTDMPKVTQVHLDERMKELEEARRQTVHIIDPTEIIIDRIFEIAEGRPLTLTATSVSYDRYAERFFNSIQRRDDLISGAEPVRLLYGRNDLSTVAQATRDDIVVILDPSQREALDCKGIPSERVLVVADELLSVIAPYIHPTQI